MWFKQISFYPINTENLPDTETLASKLSEAAFAPVQGLEWFSEGFASPYSFTPESVFPADFTLAISLKKEEKILPATVIRDLLNEKISEIADNENRQVGKKEKQELKEKITDDLLPRAFTRSSRTMGIIDLRHQFLLVNHASSNKAENLLSKLREALGGLEAKLPNTQTSPSTLMTHWLSQGAAEGGFELDCDCELKGSGDIVPVVKIAKQDLSTDEVRQHLNSGKTVTQLGLVWREQIAFILTSDFTLKRIQYLDVLQEEAENHGDDAASLAFATQILMAQSICTMIQELISLLGGLQE